MLIAKNFIKVLKNPKSLFVGILGFFCIYAPVYFLVDKHSIVLGYGEQYYFWTEVVLGTMIALLFGLFLAATVYKILYFGIGEKQSKLGFLGGFFGVLAGGCPACSITFASYVGLAGLVSLLPYHGLELKIVSILFLLYACYSTLKHLETCTITPKKKKS